MQLNSAPTALALAFDKNKTGAEKIRKVEMELREHYESLLNPSGELVARTETEQKFLERVEEVKKRGRPEHTIQPVSREEHSQHRASEGSEDD